MRTKRPSILTAVFCTIVGTQQIVSAQPQAQKPTAPEEAAPRILSDISNVPIPSLGTQDLSMPEACTSDGSVFAQTEAGFAIGELTSISADGKTVTKFGVQKVNDLKNPRLVSYFVSDGSIYLLLSTHEPGEPRDAFVPQPDGSVKKVKIPTARGSRHAIARFKPDGTYTGSTFLDVPFMPQKIGVFATGDFLISGIEGQSGAGGPLEAESKLALVASSGQLLEFIETKGDPNARTSPDGSNVGKWFRSVGLSEIVADGSNLLLVRPEQNTPVYSISPSGDATALKLEIPENYTLHDLKVNGAELIGLIARNDSGSDSQLISFDRDTGKITGRYVIRRELGLRSRASTAIFSGL